MTVQQLREAIASMPDHLEVIVELPSPAVGMEPDYFLTLDCSREHELPRGNYAVVRVRAPE